MNSLGFPELDAKALVGTRDAAHAYAQILGDWRASSMPHQKHWWEVAVQPSLRGLTTGIVHAGVDFQLEIDLIADRCRGWVASGAALDEPLAGRPAWELAEVVEHFLLDNGVDRDCIPADKQRDSHARATENYSPEVAQALAAALRSVALAMNQFRAGIREETSPIQIWPHHFDLAMCWLPGEKIPGQDPDDAEMSDKQMNFGFSFGDAGIPEPYFYITAYPLPDALPDSPLPAGTTWHSTGFSGAVLLYRTLLENSDPGEYLVDLWHGLLVAGRQHMLTNQA